MIRYLLVLIVVSSCDVFFPETYYVPDSVEPYIESFRQEAAKRGVYAPITNIEVQIVPRDGMRLKGSIASARMRHETIEMQICKEVWDNPHSDWFKEPVIFHELAHKVLEREHVSNDSLSIMTENGSAIFPKYEENREAILNELFSVGI